MKKQIKNIERFGQGSVEEHVHFFHDMGRRAKGRQKHPNRQRNDYRIGYFIE
jgi:hypothetical protein